MKRYLLFLVAISLLVVLAGCEEPPGVTNAGTDSAPTNANDPVTNESTDGFVPVAADMTKLEAGFSVVRYDGDYAFDLFLEQDGANSDQNVLRFLTSTLLRANAGLKMGGNPFPSRAFVWTDCWITNSARPQKTLLR